MRTKFSVRDLIKPYLVEWPMSENLDPLTFQLNRLVAEFDDLALGYEAKWGIGQLEAWAAADNPDLAERFQRQIDKLADALAEKNLVATQELVMGFKRAYEALEADCEARGRVCTTPVVFFYRRGSTAYKITRTISQARALAKGDDCVVMSCEELINFYHSAAVDVYTRRDGSKPVVSVVDDDGFDWKKGDNLPEGF